MDITQIKEVVTAQVNELFPQLKTKQSYHHGVVMLITKNIQRDYDIAAFEDTTYAAKIINNEIQELQVALCI
ncbi:hypothetical protein [Halobacillus sp. Cin3]|uniref:hypothetical protein n=1 Tax=Halobacillus sp. Cin3 TaxID=2928441 RepID=UPI00248EF179|nr:hypothetical protein [Halobacillus sp. Cin3]